MSIVFCGDTHGGENELRRLNNRNVKQANSGEYPSHVIILGDAGIIWYMDSNNLSKEKYWLDWLNAKPWITLCTLGNHECYERIYRLPLVDLYGGKAYQVSEKIYFLQHGHVFTIEGKSFFNFGGGLSIDKASRINRLSWWEEEIPTTADWIRGDENLKKVDYKVDYVISHTGPQEAINVFKSSLPFGHLAPEEDAYYDLKTSDPTVKMLNAYLLNGIKFTLWLFGHFHLDRDVRVNNREYREYKVLYRTLFSLS